MLPHLSDLGKEVLDFHPGPGLARTTASAKVPSERVAFLGSSLEAVRIRVHPIRQFQSDPLSPHA